MKKIRLSTTIALSLIFVLSCTYEDIVRPPDCDGSLILSILNISSPAACGLMGSVIVNANGGKEPYQYSLNGGARQQSGNFTNLSPGTYSVSVFDSKNCENTQDAVIINSPPNSSLDLKFSVTGDSQCLTDVGSVTLTGVGGNGALQYSFNNSPFSATVTYSGLAPGTYDSKVMDTNGCLVTKSVVVNALSSVSFAGFIKPLIDTKCAFSSNCHGSGALQPNFLTYSDIKAKADRIKTKTGNKSMPKIGSLSDDQIKQIACWVDEGALDN